MDGLSLPLDERCLTPDSAVLMRCDAATLPVILTAPHGGSLANVISQSLLARVPGKGIRTKSDLQTLRLLRNIDDAIHKLCGLHPHIVAARFHRKYIDANRDHEEVEEQAYHPDCDLARSAYEEYHRSIEQCIMHSRELFPDKIVLLLDIHGQKLYHDHVVLGTRNGKTIVHPDAIPDGSCTAPGHAFIQQLRSHLSVAVLPATGQSDIPRYSGGYTVGHHSRRGCVDGIQLEFGPVLRTTPTYSVRIGQTIAEVAMHAFSDSIDTAFRNMSPGHTLLATQSPHLARIISNFFIPGRVINPWEAGVGAAQEVSNSGKAMAGFQIALSSRDGRDGRVNVFESGATPLLVRDAKLHGYVASSAMRGVCVALSDKVESSYKRNCSGLDGVLVSYEFEGELQMSKEEYAAFLRTQVGGESGLEWTSEWSVGHVAVLSCKSMLVEEDSAFNLAWVLSN